MSISYRISTVDASYQPALERKGDLGPKDRGRKEKKVQGRFPAEEGNMERGLLGKQAEGERESVTVMGHCGPERGV